MYCLEANSGTATKVWAYRVSPVAAATEDRTVLSSPSTSAGLVRGCFGGRANDSYCVALANGGNPYSSGSRRQKRLCNLLPAQSHQLTTLRQTSVTTSCPHLSGPRPTHSSALRAPFMCNAECLLALFLSLYTQAHRYIDL
ncbi:unnamed protein product [Protopolystoma xenopodis]|uniref:Uncharacterized protein n=1 Tax=Protopolystoma xenopodis TaxID=117903 RepID=A0A448X9R9_9PLAT|nr:unnamed protein product [Protopolystoma xenopodis]